MSSTYAAQGAGFAGGERGRTRSTGLCILWAILTLSLYTYVWTYKTHAETKRYSGNGVGGVLGLIIYLLISPVTFFVVPSEVRHLYESDKMKSPVRGVTGLWILLPILGIFIWFVKIQGALNHYWRMKAAGR
jgi:Domain of unknown function (DUF4234)